MTHARQLTAGALLLALGLVPLHADAPMELTVAGGHIHVRISGDAGALRPKIQKWVETSARAVADYMGRFPVADLALDVHLTDRDGVTHGVTHAGRHIRVDVGRSATDETFYKDWVLTHEMMHLAFPDMHESYSWMGEGLSDYVEPIARARIGAWPVERVWKDYVEGMPKGLPEPGDKGLDNTPTWGRIYWGGALFWLLADVRIREETNGNRSLQDAVRTILNAGGDGNSTWPIDRVLETGDAATKTHVLRDLHATLGQTPENVDLDKLWAKLGVRDDNGTITFDDRAPDADIRRAITTRRGVRSEPVAHLGH